MYHQYHRVVKRQIGPLNTQEMYRKGQSYCHAETSPVKMALELLPLLVKKGGYKSRGGTKSVQIIMGMEICLRRTDQCCSISLAK